MGKFKSVIIALIVLCFLGIGNISAFAANSNSGLGARFSTPEWESSLKITNKYKEYDVEYSKEYKNGLGMLSMEYGKCDIYSEKKPKISREEYDTKYYFKHHFHSYSIYETDLVTISDKEYIRVEDDLLPQVYIHVENGIIHQFRFWVICVSEEEIETVLQSAEYPSIATINSIIENNSSSKGSSKETFSYAIFAIVVLGSMIVIATVIVFIRELSRDIKKAIKSQKTSAQLDDIDNGAKHPEEHTSDDSVYCDTKRDMQSKGHSDTFEDIDNSKKCLLEYLYEDPIYCDSVWRVEHSDGDVFDSGNIDWYCLKDDVELKDAVSQVVEFKQSLYEKRDLDSFYEYEAEKQIYIRVSSEDNDLSPNVTDLCKENGIDVIVDRGEHTYYSLTEKQLYKDDTILGYGSVDDAATKYERYQRKLENENE